MHLALKSRSFVKDHVFISYSVDDRSGNDLEFVSNGNLSARERTTSNDKHFFDSCLSNFNS